MTDHPGGPETGPPDPSALRAGSETRPSARAAGPVIGICKDLFFVARIRETARLADVPLKFARTPDELHAALDDDPRLILMDLTGGFDYGAMFSALDARRTPGPREIPDARPPVLAFTTHALAKQTLPWHARCDRVVTKETLTAELPQLLTDGIGSSRRATA